MPSAPDSSTKEECPSTVPPVPPALKKEEPKLVEALKEKLKQLAAAAGKAEDITPEKLKAILKALNFVTEAIQKHNFNEADAKVLLGDLQNIFDRIGHTDSPKTTSAVLLFFQHLTSLIPGFEAPDEDVQNDIAAVLFTAYDGRRQEAQATADAIKQLIASAKC